jgi:hypothetical protein
METNGIIILVLWIVMIIYIPVFFLQKKIQKNTYIVLTIIFILTTLANAAYSIYLTHTDQNISKNGEKKLKDLWVASSSGSCVMIFFIIVFFILLSEESKSSKKEPIGNNTKLLENNNNNKTNV